jgi:hypothetical protein
MKKKILFLMLLFAGALSFPVIAQLADNPVLANLESDGKKSTEISISVFNNKLYILNAPENSSLEIRNMLGEKVHGASIGNTDKEELYLNLKKGFYIVKIGNTLQRIVIK